MAADSKNLRISRVLMSLALATASFVSMAQQAQAVDENALKAIAEFRNQPRLNLPVRVTQAQWTPQFEEQFSQFVAQFGRGVRQYPGRSVKWYMKQPQINMYAQTDHPDMVLFSDCADLPYFLRTYFAWKNGLPMSVTTGAAMMTQPVASRPTLDNALPNAKTENSPYGNYLTGRGVSNVPDQPGREKNFINYWSNILDSVSTRTFRASPLSPNYNEFSDIYPVRLDRNGVRPGTIVHSNGHIYVVFEVDPKGTIHMVDAHPDNSVSYKIIKPSTLDRSRPDQAFGFFRFRPLRLVGGKFQADGSIAGSKVVAMPDRDLIQQGLYSLEQWFGPDSTIVPGQPVDPDQWTKGFKAIGFFDFLQVRMRGEGVVLYADEAVGDLMNSLCEEFKQRVVDIDKAIEAGMTRLPHLDALPANIYSAESPWEDYSSPSRDSRLRKAAADMPSLAVQKYRQSKQRGLGIEFRGTARDFQASMLQKLNDLDRSCVVTYKGSSGQQYTMNFTQMISRLPKMSFDPYHCSERRWGASQQEMATCADQDAGGRWYNAQQSMRNTVGKTDANERLVIRSDRPITLEMLESQRYVDQGPQSQINLGTARSAVLELRAYFSSPEFLNSLERQ